ncbi:hypothetical protein A4X13_0g9001 [Tilletia indica]|uniref:Uncharacterized protein n=1 Tax=Tilletia indica TaxID=43049 RepID=A0A8T8SC16_9BASI|nr:hypothetical protein A4X13_0g9001 [Tilletia indica]
MQLIILALVCLAQVASFGSFGVAASFSIKRQEPKPGKTLYVNAPCSITYKTGDLVAVNWLNAPLNGNVQVALMSHNPDKVAYKLTTAPPKIDSNFCDSDNGLGVPVKHRTCGRVEFKMPSLVASGNYSFRVSSLPPAPHEEEYTDIVLVKKTNKDVPFQLLPIKGANGSTYTPTGEGYPSSSSSHAASANHTSAPAAGVVKPSNTTTITDVSPAANNSNVTTTAKPKDAAGTSTSGGSKPSAGGTFHSVSFALLVGSVMVAATWLGSF